MHPWSTTRLATQLVAGKVTPSDKVNYFLLSAALSVVLMYAIYCRPGARSWFRAFEALVTLLVAVGGARRVALLYRTSLDGRFFEAVTLLSVPLLLRTVLAFCAFTFIPVVIFAWVLPQLALGSTANAQAFAYWYGRWLQIYPFLVATLLTYVFWARLAHHVAYVAAGHCLSRRAHQLRMHFRCPLRRLVAPGLPWRERRVGSERHSRWLSKPAIAWEMVVKVLLVFVAWCLLLAVAWPLALLVLVVTPFVCLLSIPFLIVGLVLSAMLALLRALLFLPARVLGYRG